MDMVLSLEDRKTRLREAINAYDRQALKGAEFRRQLNLAHSEGLLDELLQRNSSPDRPLSDQSKRKAESENQAIPLPLSGRCYQRTAFGWEVCEIVVCASFMVAPQVYEVNLPCAAQYVKYIIAGAFLVDKGRSHIRECRAGVR